MAGLFDDLIPGAKPAASSSGGGMFDDLIPKKAKSRNIAAVANDTVIEAANALAGGVKSVGDFVAPGNAVSQFIDENIIKAGEANQSNVVKGEKARYRSDMESADGIGDEIGSTLGYVGRNPLQSLAQAAGSFALPGAAVKAGGMLGSAAGLGAKGATRAGLAGGAVAGAALSGGDAAGTAYELVKRAGGSDEEATEAAHKASVLPAAIGAAGGVIGAERLLAGAGGFKGGMLSQALKTAGVEGAQEAVEEGVTQYEGQRAAMPYDASIDPMKGVAGAATMGAVLGGATGAGVSLLTGKPEEAPKKKPDVADVLAAPDLGTAINFSMEAVKAPAANGLDLAPLAGAATNGLDFEADPRFAGAPVLRNGEGNAPTFGSKQQADIHIGEQALFQSHEAVQVAPGKWEVAPTAATRELMGLNKPVPIPAPEARELTDEERATYANRMPMSDRKAIERGIPTGEATEFDAIPAGEATELDPEVIQPTDLKAKDGDPFVSKTGAQARAFASGGGKIITIPNHFGPGEAGFVVRPLVQGQPNNTRGPNAGDLPKARDVTQPDVAGTAGLAAGAADGRAPDGVGSGGNLRPLPDVNAGVRPAAPAPEQRSGEVAPAGSGSQPNAALKPAREEISAAYKVASGFFGKDTVAPAIQNDWQRLLDAADARDAGKLAALEDKYRADEERDGLGAGTSGAGPSKVKQARRGASQIPRFARAIREAIERERPAAEVPSATFSQGQRVTLAGKSYTVKDAKPSAVILTRQKEDGGTESRVIKAGTDNWNAIQGGANEVANTQPNSGGVAATGIAATSQPAAQEPDAQPTPSTPRTQETAPPAAAQAEPAAAAARPADLETDGVKAAEQQYDWIIANRPSSIAVGLRGDNVPMAFQQRQQAQKMLDAERPALREKYRIVAIGAGAGRRFYVIPTLAKYMEKAGAPTASKAETPVQAPSKSVAGAPDVSAPDAERYAAGRALTKEQRKQVLDSLVDVYKAKGADREMKGQGRDGNERYGYVHSPELFEKSDITGAMVRYYVTLPDGKRAHPSELFPDYTQSDIEAVMAKREADERTERESQAGAEARADKFAAPTVADAEASWKDRNKSGAGNDPLLDWRTGQRYTLVAMEKGGKFYSVRNDDATLMGRLESAGWKRAEAAQRTPKAQAVKEALAATHKDPGEPAEAVTPAVVREAIKTGVQATDRKPSAMKAELLARVDELMAEASDEELPSINDLDLSKDTARKWMVSNGFKTIEKAQEWLTDKFYERRAEASKRIGYRTVKIEGDGTFTILNTKQALAEFRAKVEKSPGFKDRGTQPSMQAKDNPTVERGSGTADAAVKAMIDDGDPQAAVDYAAARGLVIADVLKGDKVRLPKVAGLEPTAEPVGEFEPEAAQATAAPAPAAEPALDLKGFTRTPRGNGAFDLSDGNMRVSVEPTERGKYQAQFGSAKSSPHLQGEQAAVDWAAQYREDATPVSQPKPETAEPTGRELSQPETPAPAALTVEAIPKSLQISIEDGKDGTKLVNARKAYLAASQRVEKLRALAKCLKGG